MGIAQGIFVVDTHVHAQRHAFRFKERGIKPDYAALGEGMSAIEAYDNSPRCLWHMDRYKIDVSMLIAAFGMTDHGNVEIMKKHPDRFVVLYSGSGAHRKANAEGRALTIEDICKDLDEELSTGNYVGVGELMPGTMTPRTWEEKFEEICQVMEVMRKHKMPIMWHTERIPSGYLGSWNPGRVRARAYSGMLHCHDVASAFPDVTIVMTHGGVEAWWGEREFIETLEVVAAHNNVILGAGLYWAELYEKPLMDPNIGAEKIVWGTDWGASIPQQWMPGSFPKVYGDQNIKIGPPAHQVDYWGWQLRELGKLQIPQDDLNLILGGNAVRLYGIKTPHTRLFKQYLTK